MNSLVLEEYRSRDVVELGVAIGDVQLSEEDRVVTREVATLAAEGHDGKSQRDGMLDAISLLATHFEVRELAADGCQQAFGARPGRLDRHFVIFGEVSPSP